MAYINVVSIYDGDLMFRVQPDLIIGTAIYGKVEQALDFMKEWTLDMLP